VPSSRPPSPGHPRDPLLDLWRGIALVDMAWVHLATYPIGMPEGPTAWIGEHTRFAAGCFVLLSGLTVNTVFGPALRAGGERAALATRRLLRRALLLAFVDRLTCVAFAVIERFALDPSRSTADSFGDILSLATFGSAGATGGLLLLYAILLTATPLLERLRQSVGDVALLVLSLAAFAIAHAAGSTAHWPPWTFPLAHWQPLFVVGYLAVPVMHRTRDRSGTISFGWRAAVTAACAAMFALRSGPALGLGPDSLPPLDFTKVPLSPAEGLWYLASSAFVLTWTGWIHEVSGQARRASLWLRRLGQWSLLVYVSHLLLELPILAFLTRFDPSPLLRTTMLAVMAAALAVTARLAERFDAWVPSPSLRVSPASLLRRALPPAGSTGAGVALVSLMFVILLQAGPPLPDHESSTFDAEPFLEEATLENLATFDAEENESVGFQFVESPDQTPRNVSPDHSDAEPGFEEIPADDETYPIEQ